MDRDDSPLENGRGHGDDEVDEAELMRAPEAVDDEATLEEEEGAGAEAGVLTGREEEDALTREGDMPIEELMAMYSMERGGEGQEDDDESEDGKLVASTGGDDHGDGDRDGDGDSGLFTASDRPSATATRPLGSGQVAAVPIVSSIEIERPSPGLGIGIRSRGGLSIAVDGTTPTRRRARLGSAGSIASALSSPRTPRGGRPSMASSPPPSPRRGGLPSPVVRVRPPAALTAA